MRECGRGGGAVSPYRNILDEARQNLARVRSALSARAADLGALRSFLPRRLRRDLARLERLSAQPVTHARDIEGAERTLAEYEECLEIAIAFSDHVARERFARSREQRRWLRGMTTGALCLASLALLYSYLSERGQKEIVCSTCFPPEIYGAPAGNGPATSDDDCARSFECMEHGACSLGERGWCHPASDADCEQSRMCTDWGECSLVDGRCGRSSAGNPCGLSGECVQHGRCATGPDGCYANNDQDCGGSWDCQLDGLCQFAGGQCAAETDGDCAASRACKQEGRCRAQGGRCLAIDDRRTAQHGVAANPALARDSHSAE